MALPSYASLEGESGERIVKRASQTSRWAVRQCRSGTGPVSEGNERKRKDDASARAHLDALGWQSPGDSERGTRHAERRKRERGTGWTGDRGGKMAERWRGVPSASRTALVFWKSSAVRGH